MEAQTFIAAIVDDPDDTAAWIAYADWLSERGELRGEIMNLALAADDHMDPERVRGRVRTLTWRLDELVSPPLAEVAHYFRFEWWRGFIAGAKLRLAQDAPPGDDLVDILLADPHAGLVSALDVESHWGPVLREQRRWLRSLSVHDLGSAAAMLARHAPRLEALDVRGSAVADVEELAHDALRTLRAAGGCSAIANGAFSLPRLESLETWAAADSPLFTQTSILRRSPPSLTSLHMRGNGDGWIAALATCEVLAQLTALHTAALDAGNVDALCEHAAAFAPIAALHVVLDMSAGPGEPLPRDLARELHERVRRSFPHATITPPWDRSSPHQDRDDRAARVDGESRDEHGRVDALAFFHRTQPRQGD